MKRVYALLAISVVAIVVACMPIRTPASQGGQAPETVIAILGIAEETEALAGKLTDQERLQLQGLSFTRGRLSKRRVVLGRVEFGKVNAATAATLLLDHFKPQAVIFTGTAGALNPDAVQGDVVIGVNVAHHDVGEVTARSDSNPTGFSPWQSRSPVTGAQNPLYFPADERLRTAASKAAQTVKLIPMEEGNSARPPKVVEGVIITGESFISDRTRAQELRKQFDADAVEMEGAAVGQICWEFGVPCLIIRSLSDRADGTAYLDYSKFVKIAAENSF